MFYKAFTNNLKKILHLLKLKSISEKLRKTHHTLSILIRGDNS